MKRFIAFSPVAVLTLLLAALLVAPAFAQDGGPRGDRRGDRRPRMDWNNMSEEQQKEMRERFEQRREEMRREQAQQMREELELTEEEFEAIQPMIERVQQLSGESMIAGRNFFGGRGGPGGGRGFNPFGTDDMSPQGKSLTEASDALRETLENQDATIDEVKSRLSSLRQARVAMQDALRQAREELRGFVTPRQEATLVLQGLLD